MKYVMLSVVAEKVSQEHKVARPHNCISTSSCFPRTFAVKIDSHDCTNAQRSRVTQISISKITIAEEYREAKDRDLGEKYKKKIELGIEPCIERNRTEMKQGHSI